MPEITQETFDALEASLAWWRRIHPDGPNEDCHSKRFCRLFHALDTDPAFAPPPLHEQVKDLLPDGWDCFDDNEFIWVVGVAGSATTSWPVNPTTKLTAAEIVRHVLALAGEGE